MKNDLMEKLDWRRKGFSISCGTGLFSPSRPRIGNFPYVLRGMVGRFLPSGMVYWKTLNLRRKFQFIGNFKTTQCFDNSRTTFSIAGISYKNLGMAGKQCAFSAQKAGKGHFFWNLGWNFDLDSLEDTLRREKKCLNWWLPALNVKSPGFMITVFLCFSSAYKQGWPIIVETQYIFFLVAQYSAGRLFFRNIASGRFTPLSHPLSYITPWQ